jgi:Outer membrane protein beta-barrel domain
MKTFAVLTASLLLSTIATAQPAPTVAVQPAPAVVAPPVLTVTAAPPTQTIATAQPAVTAVPSTGTTAVASSPLAVPETEPKDRIGAELSLLPVGSLKASAGGTTLSGDTNVTFGIGGVLQHSIDEHFTVEFAPGVVFNVKGSGADNSATEIDLRYRVTAGGYASPQVRLYGALEPGYSFLVLSDNPADVTSPNGLSLGLAVGAAFKTAPKMMVTTELGYQFGFQSTMVGGMDLDVRANFLHVTVGLLFDL